MLTTKELTYFNLTKYTKKQLLNFFPTIGNYYNKHIIISIILTNNLEGEDYVREKNVLDRASLYYFLSKNTLAYKVCGDLLIREFDGLSTFGFTKTQLMVCLITWDLSTRYERILRFVQGRVEYFEDTLTEVEEIQCFICCMNKVCIVFNCTHVTCYGCSKKLHECHVCRTEITSRSLFRL
jgi:hypothetical protein